MPHFKDLLDLLYFRSTCNLLGRYSDSMPALWQSRISNGPVEAVPICIQTALCLLTKVHPMSKTTWINYRKAVFDDWGLWFRLALPGLLMISLEWTIFEIGSIVAGVLSQRELAAQAIIYNIESLFYTLLPLGIGSAASIRVGHFLGARSVVGPRSVTSVSLIVMCLLSAPTMLIFATMRFQIPRIFTQDEEVVHTAGKLLPILAFFQFLDGIGGCLLRMLFLCAAVCSMFVLCHLLSVILMRLWSADWNGIDFGARYGTDGLWYGLSIGVFFSSVTYVIVCARLDWKNQVQLAMLRVNPVAFDRHVTRVSTVYQVNEELKHNTSTRHLDPPSTETRPLLVSHRERESYLEETDEMKVRETRNLRPRKGLLNCGGRISFAVTLLSLFFACLLCRLFVCWSEYFGVYCVYNNGTFLNFPNEMELARFLNDSLHNTNCTVVIP
ncbi:Multidrug and toxin extrusion protein [Fasciola gigantica]|uniref:Multidrug and toxin extrusion protein n=1 Tax=Fasciola gigantica TaxID=46835 RepID=A0A504YSU6_FASGI|nr:Multidrug and toxin extrusion protein [Fasciola gigantica]